MKGRMGREGATPERTEMIWNPKGILETLSGGQDRPTHAVPVLTSAGVGDAFLAMPDLGSCTPLKLNKLVYLAFGRWTTLDVDDLCLDAPEVWRHGPVMKDLYHATARHRSKPVPRLAAGYGPAVDVRRMAVITSVAEDFRHWNDLQMSSICHAPGSAWMMVAEAADHQVPAGTTIPSGLLAKCFAADPFAGYRDRGRADERASAPPMPPADGSANPSFPELRRPRRRATGA